MKKVLVTVDGSEYSKTAFERALEEAEELGDELTILRVVKTYETEDKYPEKIFKKEIKKAKKFLSQLKEEAEEKGVKAKTEVITGYTIANEIVKYANEKDLDKIVIGGRGKTGLETIHLGSVTEGVVKRARCPVLVVR